MSDSGLENGVLVKHTDEETFLFAFSQDSVFTPFCSLKDFFPKLIKKKKWVLDLKVNRGGLPWWRSGWESACQCRGHGFEPWSGRIPHAAEQLKKKEVSWGRQVITYIKCTLRAGTYPRWEIIFPNEWKFHLDV